MGSYRLSQGLGRIVSLTVFVVASILFLGTLSGCKSSEPPVQALHDNYAAHRAAFSMVATSAASHGDLTVARAYSSTSTGTVPAVLRTRYKDFLREVGAKQIEFWDDVITVQVESEGLAVSGMEWGYYHTIDSRPLDESDSGYESTALGGGWYTYIYRF